LTFLGLLIRRAGYATVGPLRVDGLNQSKSNNIACVENYIHLYLNYQKMGSDPNTEVQGKRRQVRGNNDENKNESLKLVCKAIY